MEENKYYVISVEDTKKYGIIQAAIIGRIRFWCEYNQKNKVKERCYDGEWWSGFMSSKEFSEQLGIPVKTIEKNLRLLMDDGIIFKGVYNKKKYDRTGWYRVNPFPPIEVTISPNRVNGNTPIGEMDIPQMGKPIPVNLSDNIMKNNSVSIPVNIDIEKEIEELDILIKSNDTDGDVRWQSMVKKNELKLLLKEKV